MESKRGRRLNKVFGKFKVNNLRSCARMTTKQSKDGNKTGEERNEEGKLI